MKASLLSKAEFLQARGMIFADIDREIQLAHATDNPARRKILESAGIEIPGAGNLLCTLGLLCYTDFAARLKARGRGNGKDGFNRFFATMGPKYAAFIKAHSGFYDEFRGGFVHHFFAKKPFTSYMRGPVQSPGVVYENGVYKFYNDRYLDDLRPAFYALEAELYP